MYALLSSLFKMIECGVHVNGSVAQESSKVESHTLLPGLPECMHGRVNTILNAVEDGDAVEGTLGYLHGIRPIDYTPAAACSVVESLCKVSTSEAPLLVSSIIGLFAPIFLGGLWTSLSLLKQAAITVLLAPSESAFQKLRNAMSTLKLLDAKKDLEESRVTNINCMHDEGKCNGTNIIYILLYYYCKKMGCGILGLTLAYWCVPHN